MKRFSTSVQKTLTLSKADILKKLEDELSKDPMIRFEKTNKESVRIAKLKDGSTLSIAAFEKPRNKTVGIIDHKYVKGISNQKELYKKWRDTIDSIFSE